MGGGRLECEVALVDTELLLAASRWLRCMEFMDIWRCSMGT